MKKTVLGGVLGLFLMASSLVVQASVADTTQLKPKAVYGKEAKVIAYLLDNNHYRKITLNDSLSSVILTELVKNLDNNKTYFTTADI
jgi:carboxyl-terminal processing protease